MLRLVKLLVISFACLASMQLASCDKSSNSTLATSSAAVQYNEGVPQGVNLADEQVLHVPFLGIVSEKDLSLTCIFHFLPKKYRLKQVTTELFLQENDCSTHNNNLQNQCFTYLKILI